MLDAWPDAKMKRSLSNQSGHFGVTFKKSCHKVYATGAKPSTTPGCPLLALFISSIESILSVLTDLFIIIHPLYYSNSNFINWFNSTAYSSGSSLANGSIKPIMISSIASFSDKPLLSK